MQTIRSELLDAFDQQRLYWQEGQRAALRASPPSRLEAPPVVVSEELGQRIYELLNLKVGEALSAPVASFEPGGDSELLQENALAAYLARTDLPVGLAPNGQHFFTRVREIVEALDDYASRSIDGGFAIGGAPLLDRAGVRYLGPSRHTGQGGGGPSKAPVFLVELETTGGRMLVAQYRDKVALIEPEAWTERAVMDLPPRKADNPDYAYRRLYDEAPAWRADAHLRPVLVN